MAEKVEFTVEPDQALFTTRTNGDYLQFRKFHLSAENASVLASMINSGAVLEIKIKKAGEIE